MLKRLRLASIRSLPVLLLLAGCATESHRTLPPAQVAAASRAWNGPRLPLTLGKVKNSSTYMNGIFAGSADQLGSQARTILKTHLAAANRFQLADRDNQEEARAEAALTGTPQQVVGAQFLVGGEVTEFGRREVGDRQLFGLAGRGKQQSAYAKVSLQVVDARTQLVVYTVQGAAEYELSNREVLGTGGTAAYDSTLNGKVLDLAFVDAVDKLVQGMEGGHWGQTADRK